MAMRARGGEACRRGGGEGQSAPARYGAMGWSGMVLWVRVLWCYGLECYGAMGWSAMVLWAGVIWCYGLEWDGAMGESGMALCCSG
eukprot:2661917-Rhodomonas_salina.3